MRRLWPALVVCGAWLVLMCGVNLATPLYAVYRERFGFSNLVLTSVFALYAVVLVPALLLFGQLSDRLGRRVVIVAGLAAGAAGLVLFALAAGTAWLYAARAAQGLAVGMIGGAATAALVELDPDDDARRAAMLAGLAQAAGSGAGPVLAGMLAQWAPAPRQLAYLVVLAATAGATALVLRIPEPIAERSRRWRVTKPHVPRELRAQFARMSIAAALFWAVAALFLSVVPSYAGKLLATHDLALLGAIASLVLAASCAAQLLSRRRVGSRAGQEAGLVLLAFGIAALVLASPFGSLTLLVAGALLAGAGHGMGFLGAQDELNRAAPADRRGEVTAAFITCIYAAVAASVITVGLLDLRFSLAVSVSLVAVTLGGAALAVVVWSRRSRERSFGWKELIEMTKSVREVMTPMVQAVREEQPLIEAARLMKSEDVGSLPVVQEGRLVGTLTDRDIVLRAVAEGADMKAVRVGDIASHEPVTVSPDQGLDEALSLMAKHRVRRLPVVEDGALVGILAQADVALEAKEKDAGEMLEQISQATSTDRE
jgi:CBS domain-containing protein/predicted MFS family arabinose efflux permease